jgi:ribonuclease HII
MMESFLIHETEAKNNGFRFILGVDEAGRGPLAGPVVAAAVCLKEFNFTCLIDDSKKMTAVAREEAFHQILDKGFIGIGFISEAGIDEINILNATFLAMEMAVHRLIYQIEKQEKPKALRKQVKILVDGNIFRTQLPYKYKTIIGGDGASLSIACASIVAKTYRDRMMVQYDRIFPQYGFKDHKGYATEFHRSAIAQYGPSRIHRRSFHGVEDDL